MYFSLDNRKQDRPDKIQANDFRYQPVPFLKRAFFLFTLDLPNIAVATRGVVRVVPGEPAR